MNTNPMASIIVVACGDADDLRRTLESVFVQTYANCEILVIRGGRNGVCNGEEPPATSTPHAVRFLTLKSGHPALALELGIREMRGEYFSWLPAGDRYHPEKTSRQMEALRKRGDDRGIILSDFSDENTVTGDIHCMVLLSMYSVNRLTTGCFAPLFGGMAGSSALVHKSHVDRTGYPKPEYGSMWETEFFFRLMRGRRSAFLNEALYTRAFPRPVASYEYGDPAEEFSRTLYELCESLTDAEKAHLCGTPANFHYRLFELLKPKGEAAPWLLAHLLDRYRSWADKGAASIDSLTDLKRLFARHSQGKAEKICLYGAGTYGLRTLMRLLGVLVSVDNFMDGSPAKSGIDVYGVPCLSPENFFPEKERSLVVVTAKNAESMFARLSRLGYPHVMPLEPLNEYFYTHAPLFSPDEEQELDALMVKRLRIKDKLHRLASSFVRPAMAADRRRYAGCPELEQALIVYDDHLEYCCPLPNVHKRKMSRPVPYSGSDPERAVSDFIDFRDVVILKNQFSCADSPCAGCRDLAAGDWPSDRKMRFLDFSLSAPCNLSCSYCHAPENRGMTKEKYEKSSPVNLSEMIRILEARNLIAPDLILTLTSGEITIHPRREELLTQAERFSSQIMTTGVIYDDWIARLSARPASTLNISLDAGTRTTYATIKGVDVFDQVTANIRRYRESGVNLILKYILLPDNIGERDLEGFVDFASEVKPQLLWLSRDLTVDADALDPAIIKAGEHLLRLGAKHGLSFQILRYFQKEEMDILELAARERAEHA